MANTLSVMTNVLRNVVSKKRIRYKENGFNLDLAYICDNIIAMGYPADNIESIYRNRIDDVYKFLEENHHDHYKIYNLCLERSYDINKFHGRVAVYPFEDHNPPTIELIQKFCDDVDTWLKADSLNVAAVHCKAGKGRTGTMICCYLLYSRQQSTAEDALACYDEKRTRDRKGVTIPSQRRYVQYFSKLIRSGLPYEKRTLQFCEIRFIDASLLHSQGLVYCSISVLQDTVCGVKVQQLRNLIIDFRNTSTLDIQTPSLSVAGDIKVELTHKTSRKKIFHFWFNTYFVCDSAVLEGEEGKTKLVYTLNKYEIDDAHKDKEHKCFSEDFKVQLVFCMEELSGKRPTSVSNQIGNHKTSQTTRLTQNNFAVLPQNNRSSSDLNYICDQKSSSIASVNSLDLMGGGGECVVGDITTIEHRNYMSRSNNSSSTSNNMQQSASAFMAAPTLNHNSIENEEVTATLSPPPTYGHFNGISVNHHQAYSAMSNNYLMKQQQQQPIYATTSKPIATATSTPNQNIIHKTAPAQHTNNQQQMQSVQHQQQQQHYQPSACIPRVNNNRDSKDTISKKQPHISQQLQHQIKCTQVDNGIDSVATPVSVQVVASALPSHTYTRTTTAMAVSAAAASGVPTPQATNNHGNIKCKSNSISSSDSSSTTSSSSPSSTASGDNEEDWESGESSSKPFAHNNTLLVSPLMPTSSTTYNNTTSIPASKLHKNVLLNLYSNTNNSSSSFKSKSGGDDNNDSSITRDYDNVYKKDICYADDDDDKKVLNSKKSKHKNHTVATTTLSSSSSTSDEHKLSNKQLLLPLTIDQETQRAQQAAQQVLVTNSTKTTITSVPATTIATTTTTTTTARNKFKDLLKPKSTLSGRKQTLFRRKSYKTSSLSSGGASGGTACGCSTDTYEPLMANGLVGSGSGVSNGVTPKPKIKLRSKKLNLAQKFQLFQSYFRADPRDFCENFVQHTLSMRRNSNCSTTPSGRRISTTTPPPYLIGSSYASNANSPLSCSPVLIASTIDRPPTDDLKNMKIEDLPIAANATKLSGSNASISAPDGGYDGVGRGSAGDTVVPVGAGGDDFYSSICDNQLSFDNSPCKSPRTMRENYDRHRLFPHSQLPSIASDLTESDNNKQIQVPVDHTGNCALIVAENPAKISIGFNVQNAASENQQQPMSSIDNKMSRDEASNDVDAASRSSIYYTPPSNMPDNTEESVTAISSPFVFPKLNNEQQNLTTQETANATATTSSSSSIITKARGGNPILNLLIIKESASAATKTTEPVKPFVNKAPTNIFDNDSDIDIAISTDGSGSGSGHSQIIGSVAFSTSSSSGFCTSECCTNSSNSSSNCNCNPFFTLDTEIQ